MSLLSHPSTFRQPVWLQCGGIFQLHCPHPLRPWLLDSGSLTRRLIQLSGGQFRVSVIKQQLDKPLLSEAQSLSLSPSQLALIREVILHGNDTNWVFARTVIPLTTLTGRLKALKHLDNRPLGALLFSDPGLKRGKMEVSKLNNQHPFINELGLPDNATAWGRRSCFFLDAKPLLVSEFFLPAFQAHLAKMQDKSTR